VGKKICDNITVVSVCQNAEEAIKVINENKPDVVFLDIQLQRETGFNILERIDKIDFEIIFTTAFSEFAVRALSPLPSTTSLSLLIFTICKKPLRKQGREFRVKSPSVLHNWAQTMEGNSFNILRRLCH
jgi:DNA-binding LytR/AlgR family response regulator